MESKAPPLLNLSPLQEGKRKVVISSTAKHTPRSRDTSDEESANDFNQTHIIKEKRLTLSRRQNKQAIQENSEEQPNPPLSVLNSYKKTHDQSVDKAAKAKKVGAYSNGKSPKLLLG
jgi:hypothetical protein